ncbi:Helicase SEN1 like protein [Verticillium longisporum]|nr:Helicase SEN1 like protein [Verticillium longisporum]
MTTIEREYAALESLKYYDLMDEVLKAEPSPVLKYSDELVNQVLTNYTLNPGQAKAILGARDNDGFTLIQGPPGTGKTKTIVAMVGALMTGNIPQSGGVRLATGGTNQAAGQKKKILVCAPSNAAVDELVLRLKQGIRTMSGNDHKINVLRLGRSDAINAAVRDVTLDELVKKRLEGDNTAEKLKTARDKLHSDAAGIRDKVNELRPALEAARGTDRELEMTLQRQFDTLKREQFRIGTQIDADKESGQTISREVEIKRKQVQQEILDSAQVLCATLSGSGHEMFKNLSVDFETVIIDEAAQCVELSALIPLKYGCTKCILVGDPKQLPPTVLSQSAARFGYDQSLFVRMQRNHPEYIHMLDTQYRMHPEISYFPSQEFYEAKLVDGPNMAGLRRQAWHASPLLGPYRFFDVQGTQERGRKGQSLVNLAELKVAMQIYSRFRTDFGRDGNIAGKIGIITL